MSKEAMKLALEALETDCGTFGAIAAIKEALAQPEQVCRDDGRCQYAIDVGAEGMGHCPRGKCVMPSQPEQKPMTEDEIQRMAYQFKAAQTLGQSFYAVVRATELFHRIGKA